MTDPKIQAIKEKLKKLIAKEASARDIGNQAEADAFASKIQELLLEYELEIDQIMGEHRVYEISDELFDCDTITKPHESNWLVHLYIACGKATFCRVFEFNPSKSWMVGHGMKDGLWVQIFGEEPNRELLHYMVAQLMVKIRELARKEFSRYQGESKRNTYFRSFYKGAALALRLRLSKDSQNQQGQYGIILARDTMLMNAAKKWNMENGFKMGKINLNGGSSKDGFTAGIKAGENVSINKGVNGNYQETKRLN